MRVMTASDEFEAVLRETVAAAVADAGGGA